MKKFLIIDGSSMLSTSYYGILPKSVLYAKTDEEKEKHYSEILQTSKGVYTNALFTMLRTLIALYKKARPDYVAVAFDVSRDTFRRTVLGAESYKANRREAPAPLREQFIAMEDLLQKAGCQVLMDKDYEADDFAASLVRKFESPELETYLLTKDATDSTPAGTDTLRSRPGSLSTPLISSTPRRACIRKISSPCCRSPAIPGTVFPDAGAYPRRPPRS